jgi:hypothetical protein
MALQLSVSQSGGKLYVYATNNGNHVVIIDHIILAIEAAGWSWYIWKYQADLYYGSGRVDTGWSGLMFEMTYSSGPAKVHATADYWEVDRSVKSPKVNVS